MITSLPRYLRVFHGRHFNKDLSVGPFNEFYIATVNNIGDRELFEHYVGPGTDVKVPWFGLVGMNIYAHYVRENYGADNEGKWDGYMFSTNWSTPFYTFANGSYLNYQGTLTTSSPRIRLLINRYTAITRLNGITVSTGIQSIMQSVMA